MQPSGCKGRSVHPARLYFAGVSARIGPCLHLACARAWCFGLFALLPFGMASTPSLIAQGSARRYPRHDPFRASPNSPSFLRRLTATGPTRGPPLSPCLSLLLSLSRGVRFFDLTSCGFVSRKHRLSHSPEGLPLAQSLLLPGFRLLAVCSRFRVQLDQRGFFHRGLRREAPNRKFSGDGESGARADLVAELFRRVDAPRLPVRGRDDPRLEFPRESDYIFISLGARARCFDLSF